MTGLFQERNHTMTAKKIDYLEKSSDGATVDIKLRRSYEFNGVKTSSIRMREPTVRDQLTTSEMQGSDARREIATFANLCDVKPSDIESLSMADYQRIQMAYGSFLD